VTRAASGGLVRGYKAASLLLLALFLADRLLLILGQPDLLHDLDPAELKHMQLAASGLPMQDGLFNAVKNWLSGPENIHHGGFPTVSILFAMLSKGFGESLQALRLIPIASALAAAALTALWLRRKAGDLPSLVGLALLLGAPLLFLKWTCVARGGHTEAVIFAPLLLVLFDRALRTEGRVLWLLAGGVGGFAVYFSYLAIPLVVLLSIGALAEAASTHNRRLWAIVIPLILGVLIGTTPWITGWLIFDVPYFEATIHASANPDEAQEVARRGLLGSIKGALAGLPHNLWPWTFSELQSPPYLTEPTDLLPFRPSALDWAARGLVTLCGLLALAAAAARRSPMTAAVALLPAVHYLFVIRLANPGSWPDIPHRYLVLVFPIVVANAALGAAWLSSGSGGWNRRVGAVLTTGLLLLALLGLSGHSRWWQAPDFESLKAWNNGSYAKRGLGQVRLADAGPLEALQATFDGPLGHARVRGLGRIYPPLSDYYLLWRSPENRTAPYPTNLFREPDPLTPEAEISALVEGAYAATVIRSADDAAQLDRWLCSWTPGPQFEKAVDVVLRDHQPRLSCLLKTEEPGPTQQGEAKSHP